MAKLFATDEGGTVLKKKKNITDCNDIVYKTGIRFYYYAANSDNAPSTVNGALICLAVGSTSMYQIAINDVYNQIYVRQYRADTWSAWKQIYGGAETVYIRRWDSGAGYFTLDAQTESGTIFTVPKGVYVINTFDWAQARDSFWMYVMVNGARNNGSAIAFLKGVSSGSWIIKCPNASNTITFYNPDNSATGNLSLMATMTRISCEYTT